MSNMTIRLLQGEEPSVALPLVFVAYEVKILRSVFAVIEVFQRNADADFLSRASLDPALECAANLHRVNLYLNLVCHCF